MARKTITKCICHSVSFKELKAKADEFNIESVKEFQKRDMASNGCGLCIPYVQNMLQTGKTAFEPGEIYKKRSA